MILLKADPNTVGPGGTAFLIVVALAVVVVLLIWSMRRQMRKVSLPRRDDAAQSAVRDRGDAGAERDDAPQPDVEPSNDPHAVDRGIPHSDASADGASEDVDAAQSGTVDSRASGPPA